ncbi:hypothetical protein OAG56_01850 [Mariniblastus sp.]|nr:hypothetical protein [Mariniblastus sp.]MDB4670951.1 hypothetical protein [Pirellulaceae bacterium]MDB4756088.1 hypothetical protein [Mariniblastus sp.]
MNRIFLSLSLMTVLTIAGCGGKTDEATNQSKNSNQAKDTKGTGETGTESKGNSPADTNGGGSQSAESAGPSAQIGFAVDISKIMETPANQTMLNQPGLGIPPFAKAMTKLSAYVSLPATFSPDPSGFNFYAKLEFKTEVDAKAAMELMLADAPAQAEEKGGTSFQVIRDPGSPPVFVALNGNALVAQSEACADSKNKSFASSGLQSVMNGLPAAAFQMGFDMKGAKDFLMGASMMAPAEDAMMKSIIDTVLKLDAMKITGYGEDYMMIGFDAPDEDTSKAVKQYLSQGVAALAGFAGMVAPSEKDAPAMSEMFNHVLGSLGPKRKGMTTSIVIPKPDNYEELEKKMGEEMMKMAESGESPFGGLPFPGGGGFDAPNSGFEPGDLDGLKDDSVEEKKEK